MQMHILIKLKIETKSKPVMVCVLYKLTFHIVPRRRIVPYEIKTQQNFFIFFYFFLSNKLFKKKSN